MCVCVLKDRACILHLIDCASLKYRIETASLESADLFVSEPKKAACMHMVVRAGMIASLTALSGNERIEIDRL